MTDAPAPYEAPQVEEIDSNGSAIATAPGNSDV